MSARMRMKSIWQFIREVPWGSRLADDAVEFSAIGDELLGYQGLPVAESYAELVEQAIALRNFCSKHKEREVAEVAVALLEKALVAAMLNASQDPRAHLERSWEMK